MELLLDSSDLLVDEKWLDFGKSRTDGPCWLSQLLLLQSQSFSHVDELFPFKDRASNAALTKRSLGFRSSSI